jgi:HD-GYP domain-containing protein (c-di-GMP phosphodiesterase class II)
VEVIRQAAFLHDIGKIGIPDGILSTPGALTAEQYEQVKMHVTMGVELLEACPGLAHLAPIIRYHHERWDGHGYPDRLKRETMPLEARILSLCDAVEAMSSQRPYRPALTLDQIIADVRANAGGQFDPYLAEVFMRMVRRKGLFGMRSETLNVWATANRPVDQPEEEGRVPGRAWTPLTTPAVR